MLKFENVNQLLQDALAFNRGLTNSYNKGFVTNEKPFFKAGNGELHKLIEEASTELSGHRKLFKEYFDKLAEDAPLTTFMNESDEILNDIRRWGNNLFSNK